MRKPETGSVGKVAEVVLASTSPFRRKMLWAAGVRFHVTPPKVDEAAMKRELGARGEPGALAQALATAKAEAVSRGTPRSLVIGADQVLALDDRLFDKPRDMVEARAQLKSLRGRTHRLFSAVSLARAGRAVWTMVDSASLTMRDFSDEFLDWYLAKGGADLTRTVGAYEIEGPGIQLFERVEGDQFTIIGLPLLPLLAELRARGVLQA
jgi:septum formation protein